MRQKLIDVGEGVRMTKPLKVEGKFPGGGWKNTASLSHQGILAIYIGSSAIQFTDLNTNKQVKINFLGGCLAGFYDDMVILLTIYRPLKEASVKSVFDNPTIETFKVIEGAKNISVFPDVSLLNEKRVLYYSSSSYLKHGLIRLRDPAYGKLFSFNVDTRENIKIDIGRKIHSIASLTGINCNVKIVFQDYVDHCMYALNMDNTITRVSERQDNKAKIVFPSTSNSNNIKDAMFMFDSDLIKDRNKINTSSLIRFGNFHSIIRVYRDIFLTYHHSTRSWVLLRIIVP